MQKGGASLCSVCGPVRPRSLRSPEPLSKFGRIGAKDRVLASCVVAAVRRFCGLLGKRHALPTKELNMNGQEPARRFLTAAAGVC
jgi:hypothetical protein